MNVRNLKKTDIYNTKFRTQFFELLNTYYDQATAISVFNQRNGFVITFVGTDDEDMPIATASLVLERKFIRGGMTYGHIEDVNVHPKYQHQGLGTEIVKYAMQYAQTHCGRVVLECEPELQEFYQKHGFKTYAVAMKCTNT